jgi:DNA-binding NarL/FixJ family response regulator
MNLFKITKIVLIEDDQSIREGYTYLLNSVDGYKVIGAYPSLEDAIPKLTLDLPDVIFLDIELPGMSGIEGLTLLKKAAPNTPVVILTVYESPKIIFDALSKGADGYLTKNVSAQKMIAAIQEVIEGGATMSPNVARLVMKSFHRSNSSPLTSRETEILSQFALGKNRKQIATEMYIDIETVKTHVKNIYQKLNAHSKAEALKIARENRLI